MRLNQNIFWSRNDVKIENFLFRIKVAREQNISKLSKCGPIVVPQIYYLVECKMPFSWHKIEIFIFAVKVAFPDPLTKITSM